MKTCPCDTGLPYEKCCGPVHAGQTAADARALMRSRYSAFVLQNQDYLLHSWHSSTRPEPWAEKTEKRWLGLKIKDFKTQDADHAIVEFVARWRECNTGAQRLHERSRFVREDGHWYYVDGDIYERKRP